MSGQELSSAFGRSGIRQNVWATRFGFYLAAISSALGLGNLWRFPFVTTENGGGAFVFLYFGVAIAIGLPILIGELMIGKLTRRGAVAAFRRLESDEDLSEGSRPGTFRAGPLAALGCLLIVSYYAVVSGWVLHFLMQFAFGNFGPLGQASGHDVDLTLRLLQENGAMQFGLASVHIVLALVVVARGVQGGIERWASWMTPIFILLMAVLVAKALGSGQTVEALRFQFYPDFSRLSWSSLQQAIGHVFFTLSIGLGTMITFGSYLKSETHIPSAGFRVTVLDVVISAVAGLLVFPVSLGLSASGGPELLFRSLPRLLQDLQSGWFIGVSFFVCLYIGALAASIGLFESLVANIIEVFRLDRDRAVWLTGLVAVAFAAIPALSGSSLSHVQIAGRSVLELWDGLAVNWLLPLSGLAFCLAVTRQLKASAATAEFQSDDSPITQSLYSHWRFAIVWIGPIVIGAGFLLTLVGWIMKNIKM